MVPTRWETTTAVRWRSQPAASTKWSIVAASGQLERIAERTLGGERGEDRPDLRWRRDLRDEGVAVGVDRRCDLRRARTGRPRRCRPSARRPPAVRHPPQPGEDPDDTPASRSTSRPAGTSSANWRSRSSAQVLRKRSSSNGPERSETRAAVRSTTRSERLVGDRHEGVAEVERDRPDPRQGRPIVPGRRRSSVIRRVALAGQMSRNGQ